MKHFRIVATLLLVVVVFTGAVFVVESIARPQINARLEAEANEAKFAVLPTLAENFELTHKVPEITEDYELEGTTILSIYQESGYGYVYEAEFQGYQSKIKYMIGVSEDGEITGFQVLSQGDTPGLGAEVANPDNWEQFMGMSFNTALNKEFDGLSGATVTTTAWQDSVAKVIDFHANTVLGFVYTDITEQVGLSNVVKAEEVSKDGTPIQVIYTIQFDGFSSEKSEYIVTFNVGEGIKNVVVTAANDSEDYGAKLGDAEFAEQFLGLSVEDAIAGNYDGISGATVTTTGFVKSFDQVLAFHNVNYEGATPETEAEKLARWKEELSVKGGTITDVTGDYDLTNSVIDSIEEVVADGDSEASYVVVTFTYDGFVDGVTLMIGIDLETDKLTGMRVVAENETPEYGGKIDEDEDFLSQFEGLAVLGARYGVYDAIAGASTTTSSLLTPAFDNVIDWYEVAHMGVTPEPEPTEADILKAQITQLLPGAFAIADNTSEYDANPEVLKAMEVKDFDGNFLGYVYLIEVEGASYSETTALEMLVAIDENQMFAGFMFLDDNETPGRADSYYEAAFAAGFVGEDIEELPYAFVDATSGATLTYNAIMSGVEMVARYHMEEVLSLGFNREAPAATDTADLQAAFETATYFTSVYMTLPENLEIYDVYEAYDSEGGNLLGHVYVALAQGKGTVDIKYSWGVALDGTTQQIHVIEHDETWDQAQCEYPEYCTYDGTQGVFPNTPWLETNFEGITLTDLLVTVDIDDITGVTVTVNGMKDSAVVVAQYHEDNVGGGS